jgi:hypothetical protein
MSDVYKQRFTTASDSLRAVYTLYVQWYTFFWTLNVAALAWLYSASSVAVLAMWSSQWLLTGVFVVLNVLAILCCRHCWQLARKLHADADSAMNSWSGASNITHVPGVALYTPEFAKFVWIAGYISFAINIVAWIALPFIRPPP